MAESKVSIVEVGPWDASVIIPAHNEEAVIDRCLRGVEESDGCLRLEVVVAANGCTDQTAEVAGSHQGVRVLDLAKPSKVSALNAAEEVCTAFPRIYLDADVDLHPSALARMVKHLDVAEARIAAPDMHYDVSRSSAPVRGFYDIYDEMPAGRLGIAGPGVYAMSREGRARFESFPEVTGDDLFAERQFSPVERARVGSARAMAPRDMKSLIKIRTRVARGNAQLAADGSPGWASADYARTTQSTLTALARLILERPTRIPAALSFLTVASVSRVKARRRTDVPWERDLSSREERP